MLFRSALDRLSKEGQQGRNQITQYTRYGTIFVALFQSLSAAYQLENMNGDVVINPGWQFRVLTMLTMTAGSCFVMWLGEQISERGIGNGSSLIITAGIVSRLPEAGFTLFQKVRDGELVLTVASGLLFMMVIVIGAICLIERAQRRIPIQIGRAHV